MTAPAREQAAVMIAFADGKPIQLRAVYRNSDVWETAVSPTWNWNHYDYRVAPLAPEREGGDWADKAARLIDGGIRHDLIGLLDDDRVKAIAEIIRKHTPPAPPVAAAKGRDPLATLPPCDHEGCGNFECKFLDDPPPADQAEGAAREWEVWIDDEGKLWPERMINPEFAPAHAFRKIRVREVAGAGVAEFRYFKDAQVPHRLWRIHAATSTVETCNMLRGFKWRASILGADNFFAEGDTLDADITETDATGTPLA